MGTAAQGRRQDAVLADGRWPRGAALVDPRISLFFRNLSLLRSADAAGDASVRDLFVERIAFDDWATAYRERLRQEGTPDAGRAAAMNRVNPKYVLRNHLAEQAIAQARSDAGKRSFSEVARLLKVLSRPYDEQAEFEMYAALPPDRKSVV